MAGWRGSHTRKFLAAVLSRYFRICKVPASLAAIAQDYSQTVVVTQGDTLVLSSILDSFAKRSGMSCALHASELLKSLQAGTPPNRALYWASIADEALLLDLHRAHKNLKLSTLNIFRARGPVKHTPRYRMSLLKQLGLLVGGRFLIMLFGTPLSSEVRAETSARQLARRIRLDFYRNLKLVRGVPFQSISRQANQVLSGAEFERELRVVASRSSRPERAVRKMARREFYSIAANPRLPFYWIAAPICNFFLRRLFSEVRSEGLDRLTAAVKEDTVVLVPMHRSHLDYIVLGVTLYNSNLNTPIVAAGVNLNFWPFGFIIRSLGGYFVKRNARNDRIHALVLKRYVTYLIKCGHLQEFFIEGGRSRSGRMAQPKVGLLNTMVQAYFRGTRRDILFVPVSITYENVMEDQVYGDENTGKSKTKENLVSLFRARELFKRRYGEVIIKYGTALSVRSCADRIAAKAPSAEVEPRAVVSKLASQLIQSIRDQNDLTLTSLAYTALLTAPNYGLTFEQLATSIRSLTELGQSIGNCSSSPLSITTSLSHFLDGRTNLLHDLSRGGVVKTAISLGETTFYIPGKRRYTAEFYKNSVIHLYFLPSLLAISELLDRSIRLERVDKLLEIFAHDLQLSSHTECMAAAQAVITKLQATGDIISRDGQLLFSSHRVSSFIPSLAHSSIQSLLWIYTKLGVLLENSEDPGNPGKGCSYKELMLQLQEGYRIAVYRGLFSRTEAASQANLINALESLKNRGVISYDDSASSERRVVLLKADQENIKLLHEADWAIRRWQLESLSR